MRYLIFLCLIGCGTEPSKKADNQTQDSSAAAAPAATGAKKTNYTVALNDKSQMPACAADNLDQLVYVKSEKEFYTCDGSNWATIDIQGVAGRDGAPGAAGKDGAAGSAGVAGAQGPAGTPVDPNQWLDPVTGKQWLIGGLVVTGSSWAWVAGAEAAVKAACANGWRLGTSDEVSAAMNRGLGNQAHQINAQATALWTGSAISDGSGPATYLAAITLTGMTWPSSQIYAQNISPDVVCVKQ